MDHAVRSLLSFGLILWMLLDRVVALLNLLHKQIRTALDGMHVPASLHNGIILLLWVILFMQLFRVLSMVGRFVLVFFTSLVIAKLFSTTSTY